MIIFRIFLIFLLFCMLIPSPIIAEDEFDTSYSHPGTLSIEQVPIFINLGFDDNMFVDGMDWILDFIADKKNPTSTGNPLTFDGKPMKVSFFYVSDFIDDMGDDLLDSWKRATKAGHEVGIHTMTHGTDETVDLSRWVSEISGCRDALADRLSIPKADIQGFRTPYLRYNSATYDALYQLGVLYDCTISHEIYPHSQIAPYKNYPWPYTLHNGLIKTGTLQGADNIVGIHKGLWQMPVYTIVLTTNGHPQYTGFDSSIWPLVTDIKFLELLKLNLDIRIDGAAGSQSNRAPMTVGLHTDYYSEINDKDNVNLSPISSRWEARRKVIEDFIVYALTKPEVRFVTNQQIIQWMRNPVGLSETPIINKTPNKSVSQSITIKNITQNSVALKIKNSGYYTITIYSSQGERILNSKNILLPSGNHNLMLNNKFSHGIYLIRVNGLTESVSKKVVIVE